MGRDVDQHFDAVVDASVDEVWAAISTGPGIDSWFMGQNEVADGVVRTVFADCAVTASEPGERFGFTSPTGPDGRVIAYEFLLEARDGGSTSIRMVASGFLPGDDWEGEYVAMSLGHTLFFRTLVELLSHFAGRTATPITAVSSTITDWPAAWSALAAELGTSTEVKVGDEVTLRIGARTVTAVVYHANPQTLAVRAPGALYRFLQGFHGPMMAMHHIFDAADGDSEAAWTAWMTRVLG